MRGRFTGGPPRTREARTMADSPLYAVLALAVLALHVWALVMIARAPGQARSKALWVAAVLLLPVVGVVLWMILGRATAEATPEP